MAEKVLFEKRGHLAIITLNRPEARNAVNADIAAGMDEAMKRLESDPDIWAAVLTANTTGQERPVFCAGADLKAINSGEGRSINTGTLLVSFITSAPNLSSLPSMVLRRLEAAKSPWRAT